LFIMPTGTEAPDYDEILPNARWRRLAGGFREVGALLVLAVPADASQLDRLVDATDGAIIVGDGAPSDLPLASIVATVRAPRAVPTVRPARGIQRARLTPAVGVALGAVLVALGLWLAYRPLARGKRPHWLDQNAPVASGDRILGLARDSAARADSTARDSAAVTGVPSAVPVVLNPADSTIAAAFAVELMAANTQAGAILKLQQDGPKLPVATFAPVLSRGERWFRVFAGASVDHEAADSLLVTLRRRGLLDPRGGSVVQVPYAFLIDSGIPAAAVPGMVAAYASRGQPVYALRQPNGGAWLYAGAFEFPEQAVLYAESLRAAGITPVLVFRKGRVF